MRSPIDRLPRPDAVLFDLDGTLVDTVGQRIAAWEQTFIEVDLPIGRDRLAPLIGLDGRRLAREVAALHGDRIGDDRAEVIDRRSGEIYEQLNVDPRPLPGVGRLVRAIEHAGIRWAIATSSRAAQVATSVAALGLDREPVIVDASHVEHAKPEPDLLLYAADQLRVTPAACWYIGDSTWDMVSAVAAGMLAIGVTAGSAVDVAALTGAGAAAVVGTLDDVAVAIEGH
jgi:HAD superfamily hydrolase (TIGR01509 family)